MAMNVHRFMMHPGCWNLLDVTMSIKPNPNTLALGRKKANPSWVLHVAFLPCSLSIEISEIRLVTRFRKYYFILFLPLKYSNKTVARFYLTLSGTRTWTALDNADAMLMYWHPIYDVTSYVLFWINMPSKSVTTIFYSLRVNIVTPSHFAISSSVCAHISNYAGLVKNPDFTISKAVFALFIQNWSKYNKVSVMHSTPVSYWYLQLVVNTKQPFHALKVSQGI